MLIIDSHCHVQSIPGHPWDSPASRLIPLLDEAGIHCALIMGYGEASSENPELLYQMEQAMAQYPGRLLALARLQPSASAAQTLQGLIMGERGFVGLKLHPVGYRMAPDHPYVLDLLKSAAELGVPTMFHCGDEEYSLPLQIARAARKVPDAKIILGHMGGYFHVHDALQAALECPNIYLETSAMPYPELISLSVKKIGAARVIFGSDGPGCLPALEVQKIYQAGLKQDQLQEVLGAAYLRLLRPKDQKVILEMSNMQRTPKVAPGEDMVIELDCRVHLKTTAEKSEGDGLWRVSGIEKSDLEQQLLKLRVKRVGLVSGYNPCSYLKANQEVMTYAQQKGHYFWCRIDPHNSESLEQTQQYLSATHCAGLFFHPFEENLACSTPLLERFLLNFKRSLRRNQFLMIAGGYPLVSQAEQIAHLASRLPYKIIATSAGQMDICGAHLQGSLDMLREYSNILVETSGIYRQDFIQDLINEFGADRVVFGSGAPGFDLGYEAARCRWLRGSGASQVSKDFIKSYS